MTDLFRRILTRTTIGHIVGAILFLAMPFITRLVAREQPVEDIMFVDLMSAAPSIPLSALEPDEPEQKEEQPEEKVAEPVPEPEPEPKELIQIPDKKKPDEKKKETSKIKVSTNKITKAKSKANDKSKKPALTQAEIRQLLASGIPMGPGGGGQGVGTTSGEVSALSWYYALVRAQMYEAWDQPGGLSGAGLVTQVRIRVQRDGTITSRELARRSGNSLMDDSVMKAVNAVSRLKPLPPDVPGSYKDITIDFELASPM